MITNSREIESGLDRVWDVVSDVDNDPKYYDGLNSVKNLSKVGNVIERQVVVGFMKHEGLQTVVLTPKESVEVKMTKGPMTGTRVTALTPLTGSKVRVEVTWNVEFHVPAFVRSMVKREVQKGTEKALSRIAKEAESHDSMRHKTADAGPRTNMLGQGTTS
ncbi:MAG: SRPBCC family protein [Thaumarchaeota archaeon]|nr:SRPBCC family protein [Nitrososphaerota archaeon]